MNDPPIKRPLAQREIEEIALFLAQTSRDTGFRFLEAVEKTLGIIANMPGIGALYATANPRLAGLRCVGVSGFDKYLIFYKLIGQAIEVVRVLHGARNLKEILEHGGNGRH